MKGLFLTRKPISPVNFRVRPLRVEKVLRVAHVETFKLHNLRENALTKNVLENSERSGRESESDVPTQYASSSITLHMRENNNRETRDAGFHDANMGSR